MPQEIFSLSRKKEIGGIISTKVSLASRSLKATRLYCSGNCTTFTKECHFVTCKEKAFLFCTFLAWVIIYWNNKLSINEVASETSESFKTSKVAEKTCPLDATFKVQSRNPCIANFFRPPRKSNFYFASKFQKKKKSKIQCFNFVDSFS